MYTPPHTNYLKDSNIFRVDTMLFIVFMILRLDDLAVFDIIKNIKRILYRFNRIKKGLTFGKK